jgi:hypothetical protein
MIRKVYEVDPLVCPHCGGKMRVISFLTDYAVVDRIIDHLKLTFVADKPPPPQIAYQELLIAAEASAEYFLKSKVARSGLGKNNRLALERHRDLLFRTVPRMDSIPPRNPILASRIRTNPLSRDVNESRKELFVAIGT